MIAIAIIAMASLLVAGLSSATAVPATAEQSATDTEQWNLTLPAFERGEVVIQPDDIPFAEGPLEHPTIIDASKHIDDPLGRYYLYFGLTRGGIGAGVGLAYADSIEGPYTQFGDGPVFRANNTRSARVTFEEDTGQFALYMLYGQSIGKVTSEDGLSFDGLTVVLDADDFEDDIRFREAYVLEHELPSIGNKYTMIALGIDSSGVRNIYLAWSDDGDNWDFREEPIIRPGRLDGGQIAGISAFEWQGEHYVSHHRAGANRVHAVQVGEDFDRSGSRGHLYSSNASNPQVIALEGGEFAMFYETSGSVFVSTSDGSPAEGDVTYKLTDDGRSVLYPEDWEAGQSDEQGRVLPDFSRAGYHRGEKPLPEPEDYTGLHVDVVEDYGADPTGVEDSTDAIQAAIDDVGDAGGGVVFLPEGEFRVRPPESAEGRENYSLLIDRSNVVLRGAGPDATRIFNDAQDMRMASVIRVTPDPGPAGFSEGAAAVEYLGTTWVDWADDTYVEHEIESGHVDVTEDVELESRTITVADTSSFEVGEWVVVGHEVTLAYREELDVVEAWDPDYVDPRHPGEPFFPKPGYYRQVTAVDPDASKIEVDIPIRRAMLVRDEPRVWRVPDHLEEIGVENFSIGMRERFGERGSHSSAALTINHVVNGWVRDIKSYRPEQNETDIHLTASGLVVNFARSLTIERTEFRHTQNYNVGIGYWPYGGADSLYVDIVAEDMRRGINLNSAMTTGNVFLRAHMEGNQQTSESHRQMSVGNLFDSILLDDDGLQTVYRPVLNHQQSTAQTVIWNTRGINCSRPLITTQQVDWGYVIGTSGECPYDVLALEPHVPSHPLDHVEGLGQGEILTPQSLYLDQLEQRLEDIDEPSEPGDAREAAAELASALDGYLDSGDVAGPIVNRLTNAVEQLQHHLAADRTTPAIKAAERFIRHLERPNRPDTVTDEAQADLGDRAAVVLERLEEIG